jgi:hypothetical protein
MGKASSGLMMASSVAKVLTKRVHSSVMRRFSPAYRHRRPSLGSTPQASIKLRAKLLVLVPRPCRNAAIRICFA